MTHRSRSARIAAKIGQNIGQLAARDEASLEPRTATTATNRILLLRFIEIAQTSLTVLIAPHRR
jgi:hypothetical protein